LAWAWGAGPWHGGGPDPRHGGKCRSLSTPSSSWSFVSPRSSFPLSLFCPDLAAWMCIHRRPATTGSGMEEAGRDQIWRRGGRMRGIRLQRQSMSTAGVVGLCCEWAHWQAHEWARLWARGFFWFFLQINHGGHLPWLMDFPWQAMGLPRFSRDLPWPCICVGPVCPLRKRKNDRRGKQFL
jgi:hypothetical protein